MNMVRRPSSTRAHEHRGGSTSAADSTRTQAVQSGMTAPGGTAAQAALRSSGQTNDALPERRRRGGVELMNNMKSTGKGATTTTRSAEEGRQGLRRVEKKFTKCTSCGGRRPKYVKTGYGNWIKWKPPKPLDNVQKKNNSAEKRKKALKTEKAMVQLKKQVKALTAKNAELQARLRLHEDTGAGIKKEEPPAAMEIELAQNTNPEQATTVTQEKTKLQNVHEYDKQKSDAMEQRIRKLEHELEEVKETCTEEMDEKWRLADRLRAEKAEVASLRRQLGSAAER